MTRLFLAAGVAALAITAPAASAPGDRGSGKDRASQVERGKAQKAERTKARAQRPDRRAERTQARAQRTDRRPERAQRSEARRNTERRAVAEERRGQRQQQAQRTERVREQRQQQAQRTERVRDQRQQQAQRVDRVRDQRAQRVDRRALVEQRANARNRQIERIASRNERPLALLNDRRERQIERITNRNDRRLARLAETRIVPAREWNDLARRGVWLGGCPPGLAKKPVACVPPGQVQNLVGQPLRVLDDRIALQPLPDRLRFAYRDTPDYYYRYGNGYAYRVNRSNDLISALLPLFGLGLTVGQPFPMAYSNYYMPAGLQPFYPSYSSNDYYRYANGYVYEIDGRTGLIEDVDPLLGYGYGYGQMMPLTYSAYNVPYQYRPLYYDTSNSYYRYAPGAIYQVDPTTSLITAVAALLTGGMTVGQPMPLGYSTYNVPLSYRTAYYDTPDAWYRYSNGYIYRVDPSTQLVTALVASALT